LGGRLRASPPPGQGGDRRPPLIARQITPHASPFRLPSIRGPQWLVGPVENPLRADALFPAVPHRAVVFFFFFVGWVFFCLWWGGFVCSWCVLFFLPLLWGLFFFFVFWGVSIVGFFFCFCFVCVGFFFFFFLVYFVVFFSCFFFFLVVFFLFVFLYFFFGFFSSFFLVFCFFFFFFFFFEDANSPWDSSPSSGSLPLAPAYFFPLSYHFNGLLPLY